VRVPCVCVCMCLEAMCLEFCLVVSFLFLTDLVIVQLHTTQTLVLASTSIPLAPVLFLLCLLSLPVQAPVFFCLLVLRIESTQPGVAGCDMAWQARYRTLGRSLPLGFSSYSLPVLTTPSLSQARGWWGREMRVNPAANRIFYSFYAIFPTSNNR